MDEVFTPLASLVNDELPGGKPIFANRLWQKRFEEGRAFENDGIPNSGNRRENLQDWNLVDPYMYLDRNVRRPMLTNVRRPQIGIGKRNWRDFGKRNWREIGKRKQHRVNLFARMNRKDFAFNYFNRV